MADEKQLPLAEDAEVIWNAGLVLDEHTDTARRSEKMEDCVEPEKNK